MTTREAASELDVLPDQVARLAKAGQLGASRKRYGAAGGRWIIDGRAVRKRRAAQMRKAAARAIRRAR